MPIYQYQCAGCGHRMEVLQKMNGAPISDCAKCNEATLTKKITVAASSMSLKI